MDNSQGTKQAEFKLRDTCNHIEGGEKAALIIFSIICILARAGADDRRFRALAREMSGRLSCRASRGDAPVLPRRASSGDGLVQERAESAATRPSSGLGSSTQLIGTCLAAH